MRCSATSVKVTPSSKVVGDLAMYMVSNKLTTNDLLKPDARLSFPASVVEMMAGALGRPPGGWPTRIRRIVLEAGRATPVRGRAGARLPPADLATASDELAAKIRRRPSKTDVLSYLLYPDVFVEFAAHTRRHGDTSVIPTRNFFYGLAPGEEIAVEIETGKTLLIRYLTLGQPRDDGTRTAFFELNGQPRQVRVVDHAVEARRPVRPRASSADPDHVGAPMAGKVGSVAVAPGQSVGAGEPLLWIEAMKMETAVSCPRQSTVATVLVEPGAEVEAGDLLLTLQG